jgi:hypothetical protein
LWRLLVALADAERAFGASDPNTLKIAAAVQERLKGEQENNTRTKAVAHA